jgi:general secretion pathway protein K
MTRVAHVCRHAASARGSALIMVVFALLVVAVITGSLISQTRTDLILSRTLELGVQSELSAEGGIAAAILDLSDPNNKTPIVADGRSYNVDIDGVHLSLQVQSENGKINLNQSPNPLLKLLLRSCGGERQAGLLGSAMDDHFAVKDGPPKTFLTVDELKRLPGASAELIEAIEPYVSVYNFRATPDFALAPERLKALITEGHDRPPSDALTSAAGLQSNRSGIFTITASVLDRGAGASIRTIVYVTGDKREPYYVFDWRRVTSHESAACGKGQAQ